MTENLKTNIKSRNKKKCHFFLKPRFEEFLSLAIFFFNTEFFITLLPLKIRIR
jgi:hypothetical protein